jgi:hypothetical protein
MVIGRLMTLYYTAAHWKYPEIEKVSTPLMSSIKVYDERNAAASRLILYSSAVSDLITVVR